MKRFEKEGKAEEVEAARKALHQHKKRADWKQKRHQVRRTNAISSLNDTRLQTSSVSSTQTAVPIKIGVSKDSPLLSDDKPKDVKPC